MTTAFRLRRPGIALRRGWESLWYVCHSEVETVRFGHIDKTSMGWRAFDWQGRPLDSHRIMTRTQAARLVADNYVARHGERDAR